jgi:hypothetical protein
VQEFQKKVGFAEINKTHAYRARFFVYFDEKGTGKRSPVRYNRHIESAPALGGHFR